MNRSTLIFCYSLFTILLWCGGVCYGQIITTVAGGGSGSWTGIPATSAYIYNPGSVMFAVDRNLYFSSGLGHKVGKITPSGLLYNVAGTGVAGFSGDGGAAVSAQLRQPCGTAMDSDGNLFICDAANHRIRKVNTAGIISTVVGTGSSGYSGDEGPAIAAQISNPQYLCFDRLGNMYFSDYNNARVRKVSTDGIIHRYAGNGLSGYSGDGTRADTSRIGGVYGVWAAVDGVYLASVSNGILIKVDTNGIMSKMAGVAGFWAYSGDSIAATSAYCDPHSLTIDSIGRIFLVDWHNNRVRLIDTIGLIYTIAGTGVMGFSGDGGLATAAQLGFPNGVALDDCGNLYICEANNNRIRKVTYNTSTTDTPTLTIAATADSVCAGTTVTYTATMSGGGTSTGYSWRVNGTVISGATAASYTYAPGLYDTVRCMVTTTNPCASPSYATSNAIHTVVYPGITPTISISSSPGDTVCAGTAVTYTATTTGGGSIPAYQWRVNGIAISGATLSTYSYTPTNGDSIRCVLSSTAPCVTTTTVSSNMRYMVVYPPVTPTISITATPGDTVCFGTAVTYTATTTGGGSTPAYQWRVNGTAISGATLSTYSYTPANGDSIECTLTSSAPCTSTAAVYSNTRHMVVIGSEVPTISIEPSPNDTLCISGAVTFTASITIGGSTPAYQWKVNGINVGTSIPTYSYTAANGDSIRCILTSSAPCAIPPVVSSNTVNMVVDTLNTPTITLSGPSTSAMGAMVAITATLTGAGSSYSIHWFNHGIAFATTTIPSVNYTKTLPTDSITARIVPDVRCTDSATSILHIVSHDLGISDAIVSSLSVWPNPAGDVLHVESNEMFEAITITNLLGQVVYTFTASSKELKVDVSALPRGLYLLRSGVYVVKWEKR